MANNYPDVTQVFRLVFTRAGSGLIIFEAHNHRIVEVNPYVVKWLGYKYKEILALTVDHLFEDTPGALEDALKPGGQDFGQVKESQCRKKDGTLIDVAITTAALKFRRKDCVLVFARDIGKRKKAEVELRQNEKRFRAIFEGAAIGISLADLEGRPIESNPALQEMLGYSADELRNMVFTEFTHPDDIAADMDLHRDLVAGNRNWFQMEKRYIRKDGRILQVRLSVSLVRDENCEPQSVIGMVEDITERKQAQENLLTSHKQLLEIVEFLPDATLVIDRDKKVIAWNRAMEEMTEIPKEEMIGKGDYAYAVPFYGRMRPILVNLIFSDDWETEKQYDKIERKGSTLFAETFVPSAYKGKGAYVSASASPLFDSNGDIVGAIETIRDITERNKMKEQLQYMATHDFLTSTPNRYSLEENIKRAVAKAKRGEGSAILLIDLDNFKLVNDTLGHAAGDELLVNIANILRSNLREGDLLARLGGDEFAVLLEGVSADDARAVAEKLRYVVDKEELCFTKYKTCLTLTISLGIVMIDGTLDSQKLLSFADAALYSAKEGGRNKVAFLQPDEAQVAELSETNQLVAMIKGAIRENRFKLFFQPVSRMSDGSIIHQEALIRMVDTNGELILPGRFIPVAEKYGLMSQIDRWVVRSAFSALQSYPELNLYVNLSGTTLGDDDLLRFIEEQLYETGIDSSRLGFEITETAAVKDFQRAEKWIGRLKKLGCRFALDDFGIGFSSFTYLRMLPVDYLKIDGSYIRNIDTDFTQRALTQAINTVAKSLGKGTIAEFVENESIYNILEELKIDCVQGYYIGEPSPIPE